MNYKIISKQTNEKDNLALVVSTCDEYNVLWKSFFGLLISHLHYNLNIYTTASKDILIDKTLIAKGIGGGILRKIFQPD